MAVELGFWYWGKNIGCRVLESSMLQKIFWLVKEEVTPGWRKLHKEKLCDLFLLLNMKIMNSRSIRWAWHMAPTWERKVHSRCWRIEMQEVLICVTCICYFFWHSGWKVLFSKVAVENHFYLHNTYTLQTVLFL